MMKYRMKILMMNTVWKESYIQSDFYEFHLAVLSFMSSLTSTCSSWAKRRLDFATREALITAQGKRHEKKA
jgi:hypothetical protein